VEAWKTAAIVQRKLGESSLEQMQAWVKLA
jgi:hypothetical protein